MDQKWVKYFLVITSALFHVCLGNSTALFNSTTEISTPSTSQNTSFTTWTSMPTTESTAVTQNLQDEKTINTVLVKFYQLSLTKFNESAYSILLAQKVTERCNQTDCGMLDKVTYTSSHVIITDLTQSSRDLEVSTLVLYTYQSSNITRNFVLSKTILTEIIISNRDEFRELLNSDIIEVGAQTFSIKADVTNNVIISIVSTFLVIILLIAVLILRRFYIDEQYKEYAQMLSRRQRESNQTYKIRPGPDPIEKPQFVKKSSTKRKNNKPVKSTNGNAIAPHATLQSPGATAYQLADVEAGGTNGYSRTSSSNAIQPMGFHPTTSEDDFSSAPRLAPLHVTKKERKRRKKEKKREEKQRADKSDFE